MKKCIVFSTLILFIMLISCGLANPPEEEEPYIPTIVYRISRSDETDPGSQICPQIDYIDENGDTITLTDVAISDAAPWEYRMECDEGDYVSLRAVHTQPYRYYGVIDSVPAAYYIVDDEATFSSLPQTSLVLNLSNNIIHQISEIINDTRLKLNLDTFTGGEAFEVYDRLYYTLGIYRIDQTGTEVPLIVSSQLHTNMDLTIFSYAY